MENKLEQLLNSLIEKGWKPFGKGGLNLRKLSGIHQGWLLLHEPSTRVVDNYSLRDLVSKSSQLWQFVCENGMVWDSCNIYGKNYYGVGIELADAEQKYFDSDYKYRLIESSLKDESELESFILDNIKIDGE